MIELISDELVPVAQVKETSSGSLVAEYDWTVSNVRHLLQLSRSPHGDTVPGPEFYTGKPGYKLRLSLTTGRVNPTDNQPYLGVWFQLVPGVFDEVLEWPFQHTINLTLMARGHVLVGQEQSVHLSLNPMTAICRLRKQFLRPRNPIGRGDGCGKAFLISHNRLLGKEGGPTPFLLGDEMLLRATIFLQGSASTPKRAKVFMRGHQLVSEFLWEIPDIDKKRALGQVTSDLFYVNSESYLMVLQLSFSGDDVGLFATLVPGDFDDSLQWPFPYPFELSVVDPSPSHNDRRGGVDPSSGTCPPAAFAKPRYQPNVPCGFRKLIAYPLLESKHLKRNGSLLVKFLAVLDQMPNFAKLAVRNNHLVAEYKWRVPNIERKMQLAQADRLSNLLSERFYSSDQGYLLQLQVKFQNKTDGFLGLFLTLLEGEYDALLEWPFSRRFSLFVVDQQDSGEDLEVPVDPADPFIRTEACSGSFWRPFGRNDACGSSNAVHYDQLYERKYIRYGAIQLKVVIFLDEIRPPRFATLTVLENFLVARYEWLVPDLEDKIRRTRQGRMPFVDSEKFYLSNNGYRMMLRLYPEKAAGFVGLYAVLTRGAYDDELKWPFGHTYRLEVVSNHGSISRTTYPGTPGSGCPDIAFQKPDRELAEWSCGEGHMVAHETLLRGDTPYLEEGGGVRFSVTVFLQELAPPIASLALERSGLVARYSWVVKGASAAFSLLRTREKTRLESPVFYSENQGYAMRLSLSLGRLPNYRNSVVTSGEEDESPQVVGLFWSLHSGMHDDVLEWPFKRTVTLSFSDVRGGRHLEKVIDPTHSKCPPEAFQRPLGAHNEHSCGFSSLVTLETLLGAYVHGDALIVKASVVL
ncbi:uncharacterized protein LOC129232666 [Uloborus diversus]|uniref:uncharacterized protein LOC129232666 n=1 Tax=Uloborus diversus TaxID=327109 RepID=UPI00240921AB|nr:uncharacterized protein LOC129232666 [Uloborus diversus]